MKLFGLDFVGDATIEQVAEHVLVGGGTEVAPEGWRTLVTPNVDHLVRYAQHPTERAVAVDAELVLPDGAPIIWASRLLGSRLPRRLTGSDFFSAWWPQICAQGLPVVIVASSNELAAMLRAEHPEAECIVPPMFEATDAAAIATLAGQIDDAVSRVRPSAVVVGLAMSKGHELERVVRSAAPPDGTAPWFMLLGASAEFYVGLQRRAPGWIQRGGLEWLYRLVSHPRRLAKRYLVDDIAFVPLVWREWRSTRPRSGAS
ncbi:MAG: WecB/TagA/CpsF family glycosyltransferase [Actinomycetota bacterium]|nr:WecB/TagA/CpsF family glycosyltransferase [Actinomycetota bacterium]